MKINILSTIYILGFLLCSMASNAQTVNGTGEGAKDSLMVDLGFGILQRFEKSTASTATITADDLKQTAAINLQDALYGRLLGLTALKTSGGFAGDNNYGGSFNVRGMQTLSERYVLILVDGFERPIDRLSVDEVESVTVLKDAAAVALYGYRGINGAVLVKTKRGEKDGFHINVSYDHKFTFDPQVPDFVDAYTYANALNQARNNDGLTNAYNQYELDAFRNNTYPLVYPNVNWKKEALKDVGSEDRLNLSFSGGNQKMSYLTLINYTDSRGLLKNTDKNDGYSTQLKYSKANIRANLDFQLTSTTVMEVNTQGIFYETNRPYATDANGIFWSLYSVPSSAFPVRIEDGTWGGSTTYGAANLIAKIRDTGYTKTHSRSFYTDAKLTQDLGFWLEGLSVSARLGYDNYSEIYEERYKGFEYASERFTFDTEGNKTGSTISRAGDKTSNLKWNKWQNSQWRRANFVFSADYKRQFADHNIAASLFYTTENTSYDGRHNTFNRANWSAYLHYDYKDKYIADVALVLSGSNRSYPEKYAFSPTASLGWVASNEDFLKDNKVIDLLKLRASFGILHSDYVPRTGISFEDYSGGAGDYYFGNGYSQQWGMFLGYLPTKSFNLETAYKYNVGIDMSLWKSVNLTLDAYYQRRDNILLSADGLNSSVMGIPSSYVNRGVVDSKGIEVGLNYNKKLGDFIVSASGMFTYGTNEVKDLIETPAYPYLSRIGKSVNQNFGLEALGFFKDQADIDASPTQEFDIVKPGDVKYKDQNGDGVINDNDAIAIGYSSEVPEINYAFNLSLEYKGIGISALFQGVGNYTKYLGVDGMHKPLINNNNLSVHYYNNSWQPGKENANAKYPRLTSQENQNNYRANTIWFADASFLKLRNCEIYYKLPKSLLNKTFISDARIYVKGENLLSFSKIDEMDPEILWTAYPTLKAINVGMTFKF